MKNVAFHELKELDPTPFSDLVGDEIVHFLMDVAPTKISTRLASALNHFTRSEHLIGRDEEMGALRLIAGEEELVVAIFECLKMKPDLYPGHRLFVRKFKNHVVKLTFYPVLLQFRFVVHGLMRNLTFDGFENIINWSAAPLVTDGGVVLALYDEQGREIIRNNPFSIDISCGENHGRDVAPQLLADLTETIHSQHGIGLKEFLLTRADFRNKLLYATDGGCMILGDSLSELRDIFRQTYHDLLWVLVLVLGAEPVGKRWGLASQFIEVYRLALIEAGILKEDATPVSAEDLGS